MSGTSTWSLLRPVPFLGVNTEGEPGFEIGIAGGPAAGIYFGPGQSVSAEASVPGVDVQIYRSQVEHDVETIVTDEHTYSLTQRTRSIGEISIGGRVLDAGSTASVSLTYHTEDGGEIGWHPDPDAASNPAQGLARLFDVETRAGSNLDIVGKGILLDEAAAALDGPAHLTQAYVTTVTPADGSEYVMLRHRPSDPVFNRQTLEEARELGSTHDGYEALHFRDGTRIQRVIDDNGFGEHRLLMRPAAIDEYGTSDDSVSSKRGRGRNAEKSDNELAIDGGIETDENRPDLQNRDAGGGAHQAGKAHVHQFDAPAVADDGEVSPQGNFTGERATPSGDELPELEPGLGDHPAGSAHDSPPDSESTLESDDIHFGPEREHSLGEQTAAAAGAQAIGALLGQRVDPDDLAEGLVFDTVNQAFQSNVSAALDNNAATTGFSDFGADLGSSLAGAGIGLVGSELSESLGFDGDSFGDRLGSALTEQAFATGFNAVTTTADLSGSFQGMNVASLGAGLVTNELTGELGLGAETATGAMLSSIGSTVGAAVGSVIPVVGTYIGSFIGSALGSAIGDLFGSDPPPPPEAEARLAVDDDGRYFVESASDRHGGNAGGMSVAAQRAADTINGLVELTGGRLLHPETLEGATIGYDGKGLHADGKHFDGVAEAVEHVVQTSLAGEPIEGGDVFVKRALYRELESGDLELAAVNDALSTARAYSQQQARAAEVEHLAGAPEVAAELDAHARGDLPRAELGAAAAIVLAAREARADGEALGLDQAHRFDETSRLNEALEVAGVDVRALDVTDLQVANMHGELVVAVKDVARPEAPIRDLAHATVDAYAADFEAAMLYLGDGAAWGLEDLLALAGVEPGGGAVDLEAALAEAFGADGAPVVVGGAGHDTLAGTVADEVLIGWQGADVLAGGAGDDRLIGGAGMDTLHGGAGQDTADYGQSTDGVAVDLASGEGWGGDAAGDRIHGVEHVRGSTEGDRLAGDSGPNRLAGDAGADALHGRGGADVLHGGDDADHLDGGAGDDRLAGHAGADVLAGGSGDDVLGGGMGDDVLDGGTGRDTVIAGSGDDTLVGHGEGDHLVGGSGRDTAVYAHDLADYRVDLIDGDLRISRGDNVVGDRIQGVELLQFGDRTVPVDTLKEYLSILEHGDEEERQRRMSGTAANSATSVGDAAAIGLVAAFAAPAIAAGQRRVAYEQTDSLVDGGNVANRGGAVPLAAAAEQGITELTPGAPVGGGNRAAPGGVLGGGSGGPGGPGGNGVPVAAPGGVPVEPRPLLDDVPSVVTVAADESAREGGEAEATQSSGDDQITAAASPGADREAAAAEGDRALHYVGGTPGDDHLVDDIGLDLVYSFGGDDRVFGLDGDDRIYSADGDDVVHGGPGDDEVFGGTGADLLAGNAGADLLRGEAGSDTLEGGAGVDRLSGGAGDDRLRGGEGDDVLMGNAGDDVLRGGAGSDAYVGGRGDDTLVIDIEDDLGLLDGGSGYDTVELAAGYPETPDLRALDTGTPGRDDGIEAARGSPGDDRMRGSYALDRIAGGEGHDVVTFDDAIRDVAGIDPATGAIVGLDWTDGGTTLRVTPTPGTSVEIATEEIEFSDRVIFLDGRDNAPVTAPDDFRTDEDTRLVIDDVGLTGNDFDVDPGDTVTLLEAGGVDVGLTRALSDAYWDQSALIEQIDPATGGFRTDSYGSYTYYTGPKGDVRRMVEFGPRPGDRADGNDGDNVIFGQVLTEYTGVYTYEGPETRTFHDSDRLFGHGGDDLFVPGRGGDRLDGGAGTDTVNYSRSGGYVEVDLLGGSGSHGHASGDHLLGIENVIGSNDDDVLYGDAAPNVLQGGAGNDTLEGRGGDDVLVGGTGRWDAAIFSGARDQYDIAARGDHLEVLHRDGGADGTDRLHGIQELRFTDRNVRIDHARAEHGEVRVTATGIEFAPTTNYNSVDGTAAGFAYAVGRADGASATEHATIDVTAVNDAPYLAPGTVDYDGVIEFRFYDPDPNTKGDSISYERVSARGHVLGRDVEDGSNLSYALVEDTVNGSVELGSGGSFRYRFNTNGPEDLSANVRHESFVVDIMDHGEQPGVEDDQTLRSRIDIENNYPPDDDDCFPIAMDLGDGGLDFRGVDDSDIVADINGDGARESIAWVGGDDGLLMLDRDDDGTFSRPDEISFVDDHPAARTDMEGLRLAFDTNGDGQLSAADARWSDFHLWQDADGDGTSDDGELQTLADAGITSIGVVSDGQEEVHADGDVTLFGRSTFTWADGTTGTAADVAFAVERTRGADSDITDGAGDVASAAADELAAMMVQRMAQLHAVAPMDATGAGAVPPDEAALLDLRSEADEFEAAIVAG